jgi:hypothetical protein
MKKTEAIREFRAHYLPNIPKRDKPMIREAWNNYTDYLCRCGRITEKQCATWDQPSFCK